MFSIRPLLLLSNSSFLFANIASWSGLLFDQSLLPNTHYLIILKESPFETLSGDVYLSLPILNPVLPLSPVITAIHPVHLSKSISEVRFVVSFVNIATRPCKHAIAPFLIISVASVVSVAVTHSLLPNPLTVAKTVDEVAFKIAPVMPIVLAVARRLPIEVISLVYVAIRKAFDSFAVLETFPELALIGIPVEPSVNSISLWLAKPPFSFVGVAAMAPPHARTVLQTVHPFPIVVFSIRPSIAPDAVWLPILVLPLVKAFVWKFFSPVAFLRVA